MPKVKKEKLIIGWREVVALPTLGIPAIKAKVDTGARTSSLHAYDLKFYKRGGKSFVKFKVHPKQKDSKTTIKTHAPVIEFRKVRSSNGLETKRPVISAQVSLMGETWDTELTLADRDQMGFRMLLGRQCFRGRMLVDVGKSFCGEKAKKKKIQKNIKKNIKKSITKTRKKKKV